MFSFKSIVLIAAALAARVEGSGVAVPTALAAPLVAPAHVGYAHGIPQNVPPYAAQINVASKALYSPFAAAYAAPVAVPLAAPFQVAAPLAAPVAAPLAAPAPVAAPLAAPAPFASPAPFGRVSSPFYSDATVLPGPYPYQTPLAPAAYAGAYPYAAAPYFRAPYGLPAFVR